MSGFHSASSDRGFSAFTLPRMANFRIRGPKEIIPVRLGVKQIADLDSYSKASGMSRHELVRRAVQLLFEELRDDEVFREQYEQRPWLGYRDEGCRSTALPPPGRFPLPPGCGEPGE